MDLIPYSSDIDEQALQADLHYMMAFGQFQSGIMQKLKLILG